jgi:topoisomerase-4 subunit A
MKDEEEDNIIPNEDEFNEELNEATNDEPVEGFEDIKSSQQETILRQRRKSEEAITRSYRNAKDWFWITLRM